MAAPVRVATYNVHMLTGCPASGQRLDAWPEQQLSSSTALEHPACAAHFAAAFANLRADVVRAEATSLPTHLAQQPPSLNVLPCTNHADRAAGGSAACAHAADRRCPRDAPRHVPFAARTIPRAFQHPLSVVRPPHARGHWI